ncbi:hypothetical protein AXE80_04660 [Wenyingzhuangia fucanilytica]|uniref:Uncharacterized protein n=1 Tax=Wenyingzhuangia fucanilytica TaxID=1790137 RepID=A0A1B1Y4C4_9FLAO|nr:hypothetical protein [Wenyingzhuangia fucanilytica]ANW95610.1 hypothetical protein AXE80_04660 [Wenyingzhuangia fucanilytica]
MTETSISLLSILVGIVASNIYAYFSNSKDFGITGNTILGVFGSILFIKSFSRLGFSPSDIMQYHELNIGLFSINILVSALGGILFFLLVKYLYQKASSN